MGALQGNLNTASVFEFTSASQITTVASAVGTLAVPVAGANPTTDMVVSIQPRAIGDFTSGYIPTLNGVITAAGVMTVYITNGSSAHSTVIAAGAKFLCTIVRTENGFINNSL